MSVEEIMSKSEHLEKIPKEPHFFNRNVRKASFSSDLRWKIRENHNFPLMPVRDIFDYFRFLIAHMTLYTKEIHESSFSHLNFVCVVSFEVKTYCVSYSSNQNKSPIEIFFEYGMITTNMQSLRIKNWNYKIQQQQ